jgi:hypothetical protein
MDKIPLHIERFITRDVNYLIGGGSILVAFLHAFDELAPTDWPLISQLFAAGIAYVLGYAMQDLFSIWGIVTTAPSSKPPKFLWRAYKRFTGRAWLPRRLCGIDLPGKEGRLVREEFGKNDVARIEYERRVSLMQIGTTMAPCALMVSIILAGKVTCSLARGSEEHLPFDLFIGLGSLFLTFAFYVLAWLKNMELAVYVAEFKLPDDARGEDRDCPSPV